MSIEINDEIPAEGTWVIYGLVDPRTDCIYYVGKTGNLRTRLIAHCNLKKGSRHLTEMKTEIAEAGCHTKAVILAIADDETDAQYREAQMIYNLQRTLKNSRTPKQIAAGQIDDEYLVRKAICRVVDTHYVQVELPDYVYPAGTLVSVDVKLHKIPDDDETAVPVCLYVDDPAKTLRSLQRALPYADLIALVRLLT